MRVLVVDDNEINRKLIRVTLKGEGHDVAEAEDGVEALEKLGPGGFDVVLSDILMPRMDGYRLCLEIRRSERLQDLPILIHSSTYTSDSDEKLALSVGVNAFLRKPASAEALIDTLKTLVTRPRPARRVSPATNVEVAVLKEYNEGLVRKLEERNTELRDAQVLLESTIARLKVSEEKLRALVDFAPIGIYRSTRDGRFISVNAALVRLLGYEDAADVLKLSLAEDVYLDAADREVLIRSLGLRDQAGVSDVRWKRRDGSARWVQVHWRAILDAAGAIESFEGFVHDIHERKDAEVAMRRSEERFRRLFESNTIGIAIADLRGRTLEANDAYLAMLGRGRDELEAGLIQWETLTPADHRERDLRAVAELQRTGVAQPWEKDMLRKDGTRFPVLIGVAMLEASEASCIAYIVDLSEQKRAERALRVSEQRYRLLFDKNPEPMWVFDEETLRFLAVNDAACRHYGYSREEFLRMSIRDIRPPDQVDSLLIHIVGETEEHESAGVFTHRKKDGTVIEVEITSNRLVFDGRNAQLVLATDVTERRHLEKQLQLAQKMEAVGLLAGGVAHDFNNLLTVILGYGNLLASRCAPDAPEREEIDEVLRASERAAALTRQLLAFSRRQVLEPVVLGVNALIADLEKMLRRLVEENVELVTRLTPAVANVRVDPGQLEQVIMNLVVNARDAMPTGGRLTIETANVDLDASYAQRHVAVQPGRYVMVAVSDTGTGMDAETQAHIFEPFFTTKEKGKGTGLGLSTVYGIVKQSGGNVWVYSEVGKGTTFKVYLPRVEDAVAGVAPEETALSSTVSETILVVEDDPSIRTLARRILEERGFRVLEARDGHEALERHRDEKGPIHLLLTDIVMPDMGGPEIASRLHELRPDVRVLFMSGYTDDGVIRNGLLGEGRAFIQKPFTPAVLVRKVRDVLT